MDGCYSGTTGHFSLCDVRPSVHPSVHPYLIKNGRYSEKNGCYSEKNGCYSEKTAVIVVRYSVGRYSRNVYKFD